METNALEQLLREQDDPNLFINLALKQCLSGLPEDLQKYSSDLYSKLQSIAHHEVEKVNMEMEEFQANVSSFVRDSVQVQELINSLQKEMKGLQQQLSYSFKEDKFHSLETLVQADRISKKLEETLNLLRYAKEAQDITERSETWQKTLDWEALATAIHSLKSSLAYLKDLPQYSQFEDHLQVMKRRFEELVRPQLYECLSNKESTLLAKIWNCCEDTGQKDIFIDIWVSERSIFIQKLWSNCWKQTVQTFNTQQETEEYFSGHFQVCVDVHIPESLDILKSFYEQVWTDISQHTSTITSIVSQPVGNFITACITMAFSSLDPPLSDSYQIKQDLKINWIEEWYSVLEFYHNVMKECLCFTQKIASLAYHYQSAPFDIQVAISAIMSPAIKFVREFRILVDSVWSAWCRAFISQKQENLNTTNMVQDPCTRISSLSRSVDHYLNDLTVMDLLIDKCREWVLGSQLSSVSILYLRFGRIVGNLISEKVSEEQSIFIDYLMSFEQQNWNPIRCILRLAISISRLQSSSWRQVCKGLRSCLITMQPILDHYCSSLDSTNVQRLLETLVYDFMETKSMDFHKFVISWLALTDKESLDCSNFTSSKGPLGIHIDEFSNDPFEDTLLFLRQTLLEMIFHKIKLALNKAFEFLMQAEEQGTLEDEQQGLSSGVFGWSPQTCVIQAGEYLLMIPQMLETLAPEETLELACCLPRSYEEEEVVCLLNDELGQSVDRNEFVRQWLAVVGFWTMSLWIEKMMNDTKPVLSDQETKQLSTDVEYLMNIFTALGIPILKELYTVYNLLSKSQQNESEADEQDKVDHIFSAESTFRLGRLLVRSLPSIQEIRQVVAPKMSSSCRISH